jgi:hypothetical protein
MFFIFLGTAELSFFTVCHFATTGSGATFRCFAFTSGFSDFSFHGFGAGLHFTRHIIYTLEKINYNKL